MGSHERTHGLAAGNGRPVRSAFSEADSRQIGEYESANWRGMTLVHRGGELGVVGHVSRDGASFEPVLHAFGGVSRSLEYEVPERAIVAVLRVSARALVDDVVNFEPQHLCGDGRVILAPARNAGTGAAATTPGAACQWPPGPGFACTRTMGISVRWRRPFHRPAVRWPKP